jgi:uncharacterized protein YpmS
MFKRLKKAQRNLCCCGCLLGLLVVAVPVAILLAPPPPPPVITPAQRAASETHLKEIHKEVAEIKSAARENRSRPFTLRMTEADINTFLAVDPQARGSIERNKLSGAYVRIEGGQLKAVASRPVRGVMMHGTMTVTPELAGDGRLNLRVESVNVGRLQLPADLVSRLTGEMTSLVAQGMFDPTLKLNEVKVEGDAVVVRGGSR